MVSPIALAVVRSDDEIELRRLLDRNVFRLDAAEDLDKQTPPTADRPAEDARRTRSGHPLAPFRAIHK